MDVIISLCNASWELAGEVYCARKEEKGVLAVPDATLHREVKDDKEGMREMEVPCNVCSSIGCLV
jgi:hypothetical protein